MNDETQNPEPHHDQFDQVLDKLEAATNILVTVKANPSIDELSSLIGLTLTLNKIGKHATAVFSGKVPPVLEFLKPEETIETDTNSLRDFIIAIDKSKADKLRYKVEGDVVRIFITPYRTSLSGDDLEFSQGDFNIDAIVCLGVHDKSDLDKAIVAHGKILHDAVVVSITNDKRSELGNVLWVDEKASSLSEMTADVAHELDAKIFDEQIATAFLTGIVAETERFSNAKTTPHSMSIAGVLMAGGANTQLINTKLEEDKKEPPKVERTKKKAEVEIDEQEVEASADVVAKDGTLTIEHVEEEVAKKDDVLPEVQDDPADKDQIHIDDKGKLSKPEELKVAAEKQKQTTITEPPTFTGTLTASSDQSELEPSTDPMTLADTMPIMNRPASSEVAQTLGAKGKTIQPPAHIEPASVNQAEIEAAREKVAQASIDAPINMNMPAQAVGATQVDLESLPQPAPLSSLQPVPLPQPTNVAPLQEVAQPAPLSPGQAAVAAPSLSVAAEPSAPAPISPLSPSAPPPPVPPPMMPAAPGSKV